jgi:hypothetical protein
LERERSEFRQKLREGREGKTSALKSFFRVAQNVLTIRKLREALKLKYYGDIRYKPVEGAPPEGSAPPPANKKRSPPTGQNWKRP